MAIDKFKARPLGRWYSRLLLVAFASLIVSEFGSTQSVYERLHTREFYVEYLSTLFIAILVVELVHACNKMLERRMPWQETPFRRLVGQALACIVVPALVVFVLASFYFQLFGVSILDTNYLYYAFPFILLLIVLLNLLYIALPYFLVALHGGFERVGDSGAYERVDQNGVNGYLREVWVKDGSTSVSLSVDDIGCIFIVEHTVVIRMMDMRDFVCDHSLDELESMLDAVNFFRINRQVIASRQSCKSFESLDYGKVCVEMDPAPPSGTVISQRKAALFKAWINSSNHLSNSKI